MYTQQFHIEVTSPPGFVIDAGKLEAFLNDKQAGRTWSVRVYDPDREH